jgi:cobalt-zinc-cadmium efflux system protein
MDSSLNGHAHGHSHKHGHSAGRNRRRLGIVLGLTTIYMLAEFLGGIYTNSLALLSDAGHMLTDVAALSLAIIAIWICKRPHNPKKTYGYYRLEILAALINGVALVVISLLIFYEAYQRLQSPPHVHSGPMIFIAFGGLLVNITSILILHESQQENLNVRGAFVHVVADALGSLGAMIAGILMLTKGWFWSDPLLSILTAALILFGAWQLVRDSVNVLLESTPAHVSYAEVREALLGLTAVCEVHDLHIWTITSGSEALSAHIVVSDSETSNNEMLERVRSLLKHDFGIDHTTIQLELPGLKEEEIHH